MAMKPKIYIDKDGDITIVFGRDFTREQCHVTLVHDRGVAFSKQTNFFGQKLARFTYHSASAYGDSGHSTTCDTYTGIELGTKYNLVKGGK